MRTARSISFIVVTLLCMAALPGAASGSTRATVPGVGVRVTEFPIPTPASRPYQIVAGPDGNLWFTESQAGQIGRITPDGQITEYDVGEGTVPYGITVGPDGNLWFTERLGNAIGKMNTNGQLLAEYFLPTLNAQPWGITVGPDGALWFTEEEADQIGRITLDGVITEYWTQNCCLPTFITTGGDGRLWFTEELPGQIGAMDTNGNVEYFTPPTAELLYGITTAPNGDVWFTSLAWPGKLGRVKTNGQITEFQVPAASTGIAGVLARKDRSIWFTENDAGLVGAMTSVRDRIRLVPAGSYPIGITTGPDGNIWVTESQSNAIARIEP